ncbi:hypothetical protein A2U01_0110403, partial [Trifolium medium]|nr:hypothetical protein [Trifolium medium]
GSGRVVQWFEVGRDSGRVSTRGAWRSDCECELHSRWL